MTDNPDEIAPPRAVTVDGPHGALAALVRAGDGPGLFWLGGYASDMRGTKSAAIDEYAAMTERAYARFDYSGHGESGGAFEDGTIETWAEDSIAAFDSLTEGPQILIGSSMGAWMALHLLKARPDRVAGLVLIAPAPDFSSDLTPTQMPTEYWDRMMEEGRVEIPSAYDDSVMVYTRAMIEAGNRARVLTAPIKTGAPVRILTGMKDDVVPYAHALKVAETLDSPDVVVTLVKDGDHRMSSPDDLARMLTTIEELASR